MRLTAGVDIGTIWGHVLLNGVQLKNCLWADDVTGEACVYQTDAHGRLLTFDNEPLMEIRRGHVELVADPEHPFEVAPA